MELLNSKVNHPGYQCDHTAWGVAVCEKVNSPRVKLLYDIYHMQIMEGDLIRTIRQNIKWIGHFHTAGNPGRNDMDDTQELNYAGICRGIAGTGYDLYVGHEFKPKGDLIEAMRETFRDDVEALRTRYVRVRAATAGVPGRFSDEARELRRLGRRVRAGGHRTGRPGHGARRW